MLSPVPQTVVAVDIQSITLGDFEDRPVEQSMWDESVLDDLSHLAGLRITLYFRIIEVETGGAGKEIQGVECLPVEVQGKKFGIEVRVLIQEICNFLVDHKAIGRHPQKITLFFSRVWADHPWTGPGIFTLPAVKQPIVIGSEPFILYFQSPLVSHFEIDPENIRIRTHPSAKKVLYCL